MDNACWILCTPRTGSSFLCELLNNTGAFPPFEHEGTKNRRGPLEVGLAFNEWMRLYNSPSDFEAKPCPYSKVIFHQYIEVMGGLSKEKRYGVGWYDVVHDFNFMMNTSVRYDSNYIKNILPKVKFIHLTRDVIGQSVSLYTARTTNKYHIYDPQSLKSYMNTKLPFDLPKMMIAYRDALNNQLLWERFLCDSEVFELDYSEMIHCPSGTLSKIGEFLEVPLDVEASVSKTLGENRRLYRMTRPDQYELMEKMKLVANLMKV